MARKINPKLKQMYERNNRFFLIVGVIILVVASYYSYTYFNELSNVKDHVTKLSSIEKNINKQLTDANTDYTNKRDEFENRRIEHLAEIEKIFPLEDEKTNFTRMIDDYFFKNNFLSNEIFLKNMIYGKASKKDNYFVIPVSMNITSSKGNFTNFLKYVENSGALGSNTRVMDIEAIDVSFREDEQKGRLFDYRIALNMYYQSQSEKEEVSKRGGRSR